MKLALRGATALAVLFSNFLAVTASTASPPVSSWTLEPSSTACVISRSYGSTLVGLKAMPEGGGMQLVIARPTYRKEVEQNDAQLAFGKVVVGTTALSYPASGSGHRAANLINLSAEDSARLRTAESFSVTVTSSMSEDFALGSMDNVWSTVDSCLEHLRATWNVGTAHADRIATRATAIVPLASLFSEDDYPLSAIFLKQAGTVKVQLLIDEAGAVKDCTLVQTSGIAMLDLRSCAVIIKGAKFKPAVDPEGHPVKSSRTQQITWKLG